jgi:NAD(P)-dependent dehydrogenase (short-subunit alcohol dehydrogenase family)
MQGKIILITGAKGGLGNFVTERFLAAGATVIGVSRSIKPSDFPRENFVAMSAELSDPAAAAKLVEEATRRFGRIDALVHLMGGFRGGKNVAETEDDTLDTMLSMNLKSFFYMARAVLPCMRQTGGHIVAIGARAAVEPAPGAAAYAASKAALVSLVRSLAAENRDAKVTVNALLPGTIDTSANRMADPQADTSKWIPPQKLADIIFLLASGQAEQVNGAAIPVYGRNA